MGSFRKVAAVAVFVVAGASGALAQGVVRGADQGERAGERVGGPVGGVVGSVIGGVVGGVNGAVDGILGDDHRPRFHEYVVREHHPSFAYGEDVRVGTVLPETGPVYYVAPDEYRLRTYRYAIVNGHTVIVDPVTRQIVQIVD